MITEDVRIPSAKCLLTYRQKDRIADIFQVHIRLKTCEQTIKYLKMTDPVFNTPNECRQMLIHATSTCSLRPKVNVGNAMIAERTTAPETLPKVSVLFPMAFDMSPVSTTSFEISLLSL
jgi:hypothetical protein